MNKTTRLKALLAKGYFLKELPPPFGTADFARKIGAIAKQWDATVSQLSRKERDTHPRSAKLVSFDMARKGHFRRLLSIPNPLNQYYLARCISENWKPIEKAMDASRFSITKASISSDSLRAVQMIPFSELPERRIKLYAPHRQILQTDVANFYHAIYTHSIPWALHGKKEAKKRRSKDDPAMFGNTLDYLVRQCQDGQTKGIPVGPDTSRIISELILAAIDQAFEKETGGKVRAGYRYIDDMFYCFDNLSEANDALTALKSAVREFELELNASKTKLIESAEFNEDTWPYKFQQVNLARSGKKQRNGLVAFFSVVIETAKQNPNESIANFAVKMTTNALVERENWDIYEAFLIRIARDNTNTLDIVAKLICTYAALGYPLSDCVRIFVDSIICEHGPSKRHFEVAWALWLTLSLKLKLSDTAVSVLEVLQNSICALMALHLEEQNLLPRTLDRSHWLRTPDEESPYGEHWLLVYEGAVRKWLGAGAESVIAADPFFNALASEGIRFYDTNATNRPLSLPLIEYKLDKEVRATKSQWLPGNIHVPKRKDRNRQEYLESLGDEYGSDEYSGLDFDLNSDDEIRF